MSDEEMMTQGGDQDGACDEGSQSPAVLSSPSAEATKPAKPAPKKSAPKASKKTKTAGEPERSSSRDRQTTTFLKAPNFKVPSKAKAPKKKTAARKPPPKKTARAATGKPAKPRPATKAKAAKAGEAQGHQQQCSPKLPMSTPRCCWAFSFILGIPLIMNAP